MEILCLLVSSAPRHWWTHTGGPCGWFFSLLCWCGEGVESHVVKVGQESELKNVKPRALLLPYFRKLRSFRALRRGKNTPVNWPSYLPHTQTAEIAKAEQRESEQMRKLSRSSKKVLSSFNSHCFKLLYGILQEISFLMIFKIYSFLYLKVILYCFWQGELFLWCSDFILNC